jgi:trehalose-6-phosphate synthase
MDYTKGLLLRFFALEKFFEQNKKYIGKVVYLGLLVPSREQIGAYKGVREGVKKLANRINQRFENPNWRPIHLMYDTLSRENVVSFYKRADVCLVTPRDDGMNLVSKEFVVAASGTSNPGMLVLSEFAGSAIDLTEALIINPYDFEGTAQAIKQALEMKKEEKKRRVRAMTEVLDEKNVYSWASEFIRDAASSTKTA